MEYLLRGRNHRLTVGGGDKDCNNTLKMCNVRQNNTKERIINYFCSMCFGGKINFYNAIISNH